MIYFVYFTKLILKFFQQKVIYLLTVIIKDSTKENALLPLFVVSSVIIMFFNNFLIFISFLIQILGYFTKAQVFRNIVSRVDGYIEKTVKFIFLV